MTENIDIKKMTENKDRKERQKEETENIDRKKKQKEDDREY